jgi:hypothetical protein
MVLTWQGSVHEITNAVSKTNPGMPIVSTACQESDPFGRAKDRNGKECHKGASGNSTEKSAPLKATKPAQPAPVKSAKPTPQQAAKPSPQQAKVVGAADAAYYHKDESKYYTGRALLFSGPVTVSSRKYNLKYKRGEGAAHPNTR